MTAARLDRVHQQAQSLGSLSEQPGGLPVLVVRPFVHRTRSASRDTEADNDRPPSPLVDDPLFEQDQQHVIDDLMRIRIGTPFHVEQFDGDYFEYRSEDSGND